MHNQRAERPLVIFGIGQTAEVAAYYFENDGNRKISAFCVDQEYLVESSFLGKPVVAKEEMQNAFPPEHHNIFVAISFTDLNKLRSRKFKEMIAMGYKSTNFIHSKAYIPQSVEVGNNCLILENNVIQIGCSVGENTFIWSGNHIGHHSEIGNNCYVSSHVVISGAVKINDYSFIGVNATIRDNIEIGKYNVLGAGSLILSSTKDYQVYKAEASLVSKVPSNRLRKI